MVDTSDLKSDAFISVRVRVPPSAPLPRKKRGFMNSEVERVYPQLSRLDSDNDSKKNFASALARVEVATIKMGFSSSFDIDKDKEGKYSLHYSSEGEKCQMNDVTPVIVGQIATYATEVQGAQTLKELLEGSLQIVEEKFPFYFKK
jgi:hypothetical protein